MVMSEGKCVSVGLVHLVSGEGRRKGGIDGGGGKREK